MKSILLAILLLFIPFSVSQIAAKTPKASQPPEGVNLELSKAEKDLINLLDEFDEKRNEYFVEIELRKYQDVDGSSELFRLLTEETVLTNPADEYLRRLQEFEEAHRGVQAGLHALRAMDRETWRYFDTNAPANIARRKWYLHINEYAKFDCVVELLGSKRGQIEPRFVDAAELILESPEASRRTRAVVSFKLAKWWLKQKLAREGFENQEKRLLAKPELSPQDRKLFKYTIAALKLIPELEVCTQKSKESLEILDALAADDNSPILLSPVPIDPKYRIFRYAEDDANKTVAEIASNYLFMHRCLQIGLPAPSLELDLLDGKRWKMADQIGKVVVVQFSRSGNYRCEKMYPDLKELANKYADKISILSLMCDETADSALKKMEEGKLTWNVAFDGRPGEVTQKWCVRLFPKTYIIDSNGIISTMNPEKHWMKVHIAELLEE